MRRVVCPGSFDPVHLGHLEIITRASSLFDEVIVAVSTNPAKAYRFTQEERVGMLQDALAGIGGIIVEPMGQGLLAEYARARGASGIVKGLRGARDYEFEAPMATMNRHLTGVETVFLHGDGRYQHVSSSLIKEVAGLGGDVSELVPKVVSARM